MAKTDMLVRMKADTSGYDANLAKARRSLDKFKKDNLSMGGVMKQLSGSLVSAAAGFASTTAAVGAFTSALRDNIETAKNFEKSMSQLSSLTGMVGDDLGKLKDYAIELGASTTLSASQVADAFKLIGSQQPQLLQSGEALKKVTENAITLAEAAGIELTDAASTLSVSINQMGGDSSNAERYINVLAAAAQKGAGDIVWLGEAITKSGTAAKAVGTDYEELVANLEQLAKAGFDASTAGTALRSIIMNLEKQSNSNFKPSVVGLTEAFKNLGEANLTLTEYQKIAGKMFASQAKVLADTAGEAEKMTDAITGTNIAEEQARINTDNLDGSLKQLASAWEGLNLHINSGNGIIRTCVDALTETVKWFDQVVTGSEKAAKGIAKFSDEVMVLLGPLYGAKKGMEALGVASDTTFQIIKEGAIAALGPMMELLNVLNMIGSGAVDKVLDAKPDDIPMPIYVPPGANKGGVPGIVDEETKKKGRGKTGRGNTTKTEVFPAGSVGQLNQELQKLRKAQERVTDPVAWSNYQQKIDEITEKIKGFKSVYNDITAASKNMFAGLQKANEEQKKAAEALEKALKGGSFAEILKAQEAMKKFGGNQNTFDAKGNAVIIGKKKTGINSAFEQSTLTNTNVGAFISAIQKELADSDVGGVVFNKLTERLKDASLFKEVLQAMIDGGIKGADFTDLANEMKAKLLDGDISDEAWNDFLKRINEKISDSGLKLKVEVDDKGTIAGITTQTEKMTKDWQNAGHAIQAVGNAMNQIEDPAAKVIGTIAQAIATIALTFAQSLKGTFTPWDWIAGAAAGTATMISTIAAIKANTKFSEGGIIRGNSYSGDNILMPIDGGRGGFAGLNSQEIVLNKAQQGNLASQLTDNGGEISDARPYTTGENIVLGINAHFRRSGQGEIVTTSMLRRMGLT